MTKPTLSIIVLSYNTKEILANCLDSLFKVRGEVNFEVIVPDNGSIDGSIELVEKKYPWVTLIKNGKNLGFAAGNNRAKSYCHGKYILFLNSDTIVYESTIRKTIQYLEDRDEVGAITCKLVMPDGNLDKDVRRAFITPWIAFIHIFTKLDKFFPKSRIFAKYWYGYISENTTHEVDVIQGAYLLTRKSILDTIGWFDEAYFLDGEDIDLCWRIKEKGWKIIYYPDVSILHIKGGTKGKTKKLLSKISISEKIKFRMTGVDSMEIFLRKRLWNKYPVFFNLFMLLGIKLLKTLRLIKVVIGK